VTHLGAVCESAPFWAEPSEAKKKEKRKVYTYTSHCKGTIVTTHCAISVQV